MSYFEFATTLAREQAANTAYETSQRRMLESFAKARAMAKQQDDEPTKAEVDAGELACFDGAAARAINNGFN